MNLKYFKKRSTNSDRFIIIPQHFIHYFATVVEVDAVVATTAFGLNCLHCQSRLAVQLHFPWRQKKHHITRQVATIASFTAGITITYHSDHFFLP